jgi:hypothetical protein
VTQAPDGAFTISSWTLSLLELVPDPQWEHFRLRAEVRHEKGSGPVGGVGLYAAHREDPTTRGSAHFFVGLSFNDIHDEIRGWELAVKDLQALPVPPPLPPRPSGNPVTLMPVLFLGGERGASGVRGLGGRSRRLFRAAGLGGGPWRSLALEVTPTALRGLWGEKNRSVGELSAKEVVRRTSGELDRLRRHHPEVSVVGVRAVYAPRGGLGLYVNHGVASFRRVVVQPVVQPR